jgi:hypothetical protein
MLVQGCWHETGTARLRGKKRVKRSFRQQLTELGPSLFIESSKLPTKDVKKPEKVIAENVRLAKEYNRPY